jgi:hypothetical protein
MSASATIPATPLVAQPGGEVSVFVQVRNTGEIVDQYTFEVLGDAAKWAELEPGELSLFPDAEGEIKLTFRPPREAETAAGPIPFGLKVVSKENPEDSTVEEGVLEVGLFLDSGAELLPRTSRGRLAGKHELAFDNRGNSRVSASLSATDPDNKLRFRFAPPAIVSEPGTATFAKVAVRPKRKFFWGRPRTLPFKVFIEPEGEAPIVVDGTMFQEQLFPKLMGFLLVGLAGLALLWHFFLQPQIQNTAKDAAASQNKATAKKVAKNAAVIAAVKKDSSSKAAQQSADQAAAAQKAAEAAAKNAQKKTAAAILLAQQKAAKQAKAAALAAAAQGNPGDIRLAADCGTTCAPAFTVAKNTSLSITDIVLQNPAGDSGTLTILRDKAPLLVQQLDNFRDLDFHFITPIIFTAGQKLVISTVCNNKPVGTTPAAACTPSGLFSGPTKKTKPPKKA